MNDVQRRTEIRARLEESGRSVIALDAHQIGEFAGNALELSGRDGRVLALSARAAASLRPEAARGPSSASAAAPASGRADDRTRRGSGALHMLAGIHLARR
jgi:hypothetical protein